MEEEKAGYVEGDCSMVNSRSKEQTIESNLDACVAPAVGMEFESDEEALIFFNSYAERVGFETRIRASKKSKGWGKSFVHFCCRREGFKRTNGATNTKRPDLRCGCLAGMKVKLADSGKWKVFKVNLQHNHLVNPAELKYFRSQKCMNNGAKKRLKLGGKTGQKVHKTYQECDTNAGHGHMTFIVSDYQNHLRSDGQLEQAAISTVDEEQPSESDLNASVTPTVGMEFESDEEAFRFFNSYANWAGFKTRIRASQKSKRLGKWFVHFCCKREGFKRANGNVRAARPDIRCGCPAGMKVRLTESGKWKVLEVNLQHNHLLGPTEAWCFISRKHLDNGVKTRLKLGVKTAQLAEKTFQEYVTDQRQLEHLAIAERHYQNNVFKVRKLELYEGDVEAMNKFFSQMQVRSSNFFYMVDYTEDGHLRNVFWVDARSRADYEYFGDTIVFDTTYLTNYSLKLSLFVGANHHGQLVLLGCGLLEGETKDSFVWLFKAWLLAMSGHAPNAIITDQSEAIQAAVNEVFPISRHRLCLWCIMKRIPEKFSTLVDYESIKDCFEKVVYDSLKVDEFEQHWNEMISRYKLHSNKWLRTLYWLREKWVPVYLKHTFWAGLSTMKHIENMNSIFDEYVNSRTCLKEFVEQYELVLQKKHENESLLDASNLNLQTTLWTHHHFEIQLAPIYTSGIFKKFQEEVSSALSHCYDPTVVHVEGAIKKYMVKERIADKDGNQLAPKEYEVYYNKNNMEVTCICNLFHFEGYLCRHALYTLIHHGVDKIPSQYIISRWRKDFKRQRSLEYGSLSIGNFVHCFDVLHRRVTQFIEEGAISEQGCSVALQLLEEGLEKIHVANVCPYSDDTNRHKRCLLHEEHMGEHSSDVDSTIVCSNISGDVPNGLQEVDPNVHERTGQIEQSGFFPEGEQVAESKQKKLRTAANMPTVSNAGATIGPLVTPISPNLLSHCSTLESMQQMEVHQGGGQTQITRVGGEIHMWGMYRKFAATHRRDARRQYLLAARKTKAQPCTMVGHAVSGTPDPQAPRCSAANTADQMQGPRKSSCQTSLPNSTR